MRDYASQARTAWPADNFLLSDHRARTAHEHASTQARVRSVHEFHDLRVFQQSTIATP